MEMPARFGHLTNFFLSQRFGMPKRGKNVRFSLVVGGLT